MELSLEAIVLYGVPVVLAITLHEAAHGYIAKLFGDRTAEMLGRVTLNPVKHVDPVGTILVPGFLLMGSEGFARMADIGVRVNLVLMALNLLPIPPLDGGRILVGVLPARLGGIVSRLEPWGLFIIVALLFARLLDDLMLPLVRAGFVVISMLLSLFGVPLPGPRAPL